MYLLDTNAVSEPIKKKPDLRFMARLAQEKPGNLCTTGITVMELRYGAMRRQDSREFWKKLMDNVITRYIILSFGEREAQLAGDMLAKLSMQGQPLELEDVLIAAIAYSFQCTLVTRNERHFSRIPEINVENWWAG